ncbi:hypothetical protein P8H27_16680 [Pseudomonas sp. sp1636]|uniref:hypothetical protein n=1 Tax=Pseudomonas sp. sp1636 TaxID=3036707 RepID=UPI0025A58D66|nr:hypothetical protein [Pseudomonas sp. sp1636]MDM8350511.1 hypothetical protein [Pseudomonas sp. sp1636]
MRKQMTKSTLLGGSDQQCPTSLRSDRLSEWPRSGQPDEHRLRAKTAWNLWHVGIYRCLGSVAPFEATNQSHDARAFVGKG